MLVKVGSEKDFIELTKDIFGGVAITEGSIWQKAEEWIWRVYRFKLVDLLKAKTSNVARECVCVASYALIAMLDQSVYDTCAFLGFSEKIIRFSVEKCKKILKEKSLISRKKKISRLVDEFLSDVSQVEGFDV